MQLSDNPYFDALNKTAMAHNNLCLGDLVTDPQRAKDLVFMHDGMELDVTRQLLSQEALAGLVKLAHAAGLENWRDRMRAGEPVNTAENRAVTHHALRDPVRQTMAEWDQLTAAAAMFRDRNRFDRIVNIGIGGSDLGPAMVTRALRPFHDGPDIAFASNFDPADLGDVLARSNPHRTGFIVTSKSFTTAETLANAARARDWLTAAGVIWNDTMCAVTGSPEKAATAGFIDTHILPMDMGVGGRYSLWSAAGLGILCAIGKQSFAALLAGAHNMDQHFFTTPLAKNLPVLMALVRIWNRNFLGFATHGVMPYAQRLARFPAWVQQLEMESNGKQVSRDGTRLTQPASSLIWGEAGSNAQHSFFQYLHQADHIVPVDFLLPLAPVAKDHPDQNQRTNHTSLVANALAQAELLATGKKDADDPHRQFPGNRPSSIISWPQTTPFTVGQLAALYENATISCGFIWGVNSFDQPGVELGKQLAHDLQSGTSGFSPAATALFQRHHKENS
jgi:glucose-6-phosphate isomerase